MNDLKTHFHGVGEGSTLCGQHRKPRVECWVYAPVGEWPNCKQCLKAMKAYRINPEPAEASAPKAGEGE